MTCVCPWACKYGDTREIRVTLSATPDFTLEAIPNVKIRITGPGSATTTFEDDAVIESVVDKVVTYNLDTTDLTGGAGIYRVEWVVEAAAPITFPDEGGVRIEINKHLGA